MHDLHRHAQDVVVARFDIGYRRLVRVPRERALSVQRLLHATHADAGAPGREDPPQQPTDDDDGTVPTGIVFYLMNEVVHT